MVKEAKSRFDEWSITSCGETRLGFPSSSSSDYLSPFYSTLPAAPILTPASRSSRHLPSLSNSSLTRGEEHRFSKMLLAVIIIRASTRGPPKSSSSIHSPSPRSVRLVYQLPTQQPTFRLMTSSFENCSLLIRHDW